jgi:predicted transglutaminase-like cysteine proteinase
MRCKTLALVSFALPALLAAGCATKSAPPEPQFHFFAHNAPSDDPWFEKVSEWQSRAREDFPTASTFELRSQLMEPQLAAKSDVLGLKIAGFALEEKRQLARRINTWAQVQAHSFYKIEDDDDPAGDHWPTFGELLDNNGDDCDGLDLISYRLLLEFGYPRDRVFRAIVRRNSKRTNHMVTLWFEDPEDPWVLDATGAMVLDVKRFSAVEGWTPTKMFNESVQYKVRQRGASESFALVRD